MEDGADWVQRVIKGGQPLMSMNAIADLFSEQTGFTLTEMRNGKTRAIAAARADAMRAMVELGYTPGAAARFFGMKRSAAHEAIRRSRERARLQVQDHDRS